MLECAFNSRKSFIVDVQPLCRHIIQYNMYVRTQTHMYSKYTMRGTSCVRFEERGSIFIQFVWTVRSFGSTVHVCTYYTYIQCTVRWDHSPLVVLAYEWFNLHANGTRDFPLSSQTRATSLARDTQPCRRFNYEPAFEQTRSENGPQKHGFSLNPPPTPTPTPPPTPIASPSGFFPKGVFSS